jgi:hypothetical protein
MGRGGRNILVEAKLYSQARLRDDISRAIRPDYPWFPDTWTLRSKLYASDIDISATGQQCASRAHGTVQRLMSRSDPKRAIFTTP